MEKKGDIEHTKSRHQGCRLQDAGGIRLFQMSILSLTKKKSTPDVSTVGTKENRPENATNTERRERVLIPESDSSKEQRTEDEERRRLIEEKYPCLKKSKWKLHKSPVANKGMHSVDSKTSDRKKIQESTTMQHPQEALCMHSEDSKTSARKKIQGSTMQHSQEALCLHSEDSKASDRKKMEENTIHRHPPQELQEKEFGSNDENAMEVTCPGPKRHGLPSGSRGRRRMISKRWSPCRDISTSLPVSARSSGCRPPPEGSAECTSSEPHKSVAPLRPRGPEDPGEGRLATIRGLRKIEMSAKEEKDEASFLSSPLMDTKPDSPEGKSFKNRTQTDNCL